MFEFILFCLFWILLYLILIDSRDNCIIWYNNCFVIYYYTNCFPKYISISQYEMIKHWCILFCFLYKSNNPLESENHSVFSKVKDDCFNNTLLLV